jgi:tRNA 2-thiocytidine biosynthesis protein TtcA
MQTTAYLERRIRRLAGKAVGDFDLIQSNDRILVALSGGKDSWTLLHVLDGLRKRAPVNFSLVAITVHPGFPGFQTGMIEAYLRERGYEYRIVHAPIHEIMLEKLKPEDTPAHSAPGSAGCPVYPGGRARLHEGGSRSAQ